LLDASSDAVVVYDHDFRFVYLNAEAERLVGSSQEDMVGKVLWDMFPEGAAPFHEPLTRAMRERIPVTFEESTSMGRWTEGRCLPLPGPNGSETDGLLAVFFQDVTDRHEAARARAEAEAGRERLAFLAEVSAILSSSLDYQTTLDSMAHLVVPSLCDWCAIQMPSADGIFLEQVAVAHADPAKVQWARELNQRYPERLDAPAGTANVLRTGEAVFMPDIPEEALAVSAQDEEHLQIILGLGFRSAVAVPLIARGRTLGVLLLVTTDESGRRLSADDAALAQELAVRAAIAVDNARLFGESQNLLLREHNIAQRLQDALQPQLPGKVSGLDVDAFYQPALLEEAEIGGDFHDMFALEKGCFALVVADLSGKGLAAASQVATVRHMLRTLLYQKQSTIAESVTSLNEMLFEHNLLTGFATLFVGAYNVNEGSLTYTSCGQEPGLILRKATGQVEELPPTGPVLGAFPDATFDERTVKLASGDVLALFTDGLTEAGPSRKDLLQVEGVVSIFRDSTTSASSASEITKRMIEGVTTAATAAGMRDDVCLLIACVE
jgi:PAS domain S-box-containing protein